MKLLSINNVQDKIPEILPVIPTMDIVVFPQMIVPLLVLDERIIRGIQQATEGSKMIMLLATKKQIDHGNTAIGTKDLYCVGTVATIMRLIKIPEGGIKILVQGICKAQVKELIAQDDSLHVMIEEFQEDTTTESELNAQIKNLKELAEKMSMAGNTFSPDFSIILSKMYDPQKIADFILSHLNLAVDDAQTLLEKRSQAAFLEGIYLYLQREIEVAEVQERIKTRTRESMNKSQKEFYLREQLRAIQKELGEDGLEDIEAMRAKASSMNLSPEAHTEVIRQINRLERTAQDSMEATVTRNYIEWILSLPWGKETTDNLDIKHAKAILDEEHHGLNDIKERILDFISIKNLKKDGYAPILCFSGPPGTGKTSLGKSIARSLGREYFRVSLGGVKDEAEIRGHRRTYVGAMPGRFIQGFRKSASNNPVIIIDELDKIGSDFRGDPSAAMLEVLDPQQNKTFHDNYLNVPFDLSKVIFIATANNLDAISEPLRDRMEVIQLSGYTLEEKLHIAQLHLIRRALFDCGLESANVQFTEDIVAEIIHAYTREAGVRQLERVIRKLCCKIARSLVEDNKIINFTPDSLDMYLGPRPFSCDDGVIHEPKVGVSNGLAWTTYGGEIIKVETVVMLGKGKLILTGQLGSVMQESAQAALSYVRTHAKDFNIPPKMFTHYDVHIHVPAGAVPKDGPSAGITMLSSILSALTMQPIDAHYAMTGELNLRGDVMPIGGIKEKILAAKRNNISHIILPEKNKKDLVGIENLTDGIKVIWVHHAQEVLQHVLIAKQR